jgi:hypothetical protein
MARRDKVRKWSNLKGQIPEAVDLSPRGQEVIKAADLRRNKETGDPVTMDDLALEWNGLEEEEAFEDMARDGRNIVYDALTKRILEELDRVKTMAGTDLWRGQDQTFSPKYMLNIRVTDPVALRKWVEETGQQHLLTIPVGRLKGIVGEAMNTDSAAAMTPAERAQLKAGQPGSGMPPPGVEVSLFTTVHHTSTAAGKKTRGSSDPDDSGPF